MSSLPPLPLLPQPSTSNDSSTLDASPFQPSGRALGQNNSSSEPPYTNQLCTYMQELERAISPRMKKYEETQNELHAIIARERIIEESTRRLLHINMIAGICFPFIMVLFFFLFCLYYAPENVKKFFDEYKLIFSFFSIATLAFIAKPLYDIHNYNRRLEAIEKKLKLNGNY